MAGKNVLVLGGGIGGLTCASELRKSLGSEHEVILLDKSDKHLFQPSLTWIMMGWRTASQISRDLDILNRKGIHYINAEVKEIDLAARKVKAGERDLSYDYLVISLGAELAPESVPGFPESAYSIHDLSGVERLQSVLREFESGKIVVLVSSMPFKCPAAPYETSLLLDSFFAQKGIRDQVQIEICTAEPQPLPVAGPEVGEVVRKLVEGRNISFNPNFKVTAIDPQRKEISFENGESRQFDLIVGVPPHRSPAPVREAGLTNETGWIPVDGTNLQTKEENVFAIGDVTAVKLISGMMLPKAGVFAHAQGKVVAANIAAQIKGAAGRGAFDGRGGCFLETGYGKAAFAQGEFFADPKPLVTLKPSGRFRRWGKVFFEKYWLWRWF